MCLWGFFSFFTLNAQRTPVGVEPHQEPSRPTYPECTSPDPSLNPCIQTTCSDGLRPPISTNPVAPSNVLRPNLVNTFNWQTTTYQLVSPLGNAIENPVYQTPLIRCF